jgi:hypothetical protein
MTEKEELDFLKEKVLLLEEIIRLKYPMPSPSPQPIPLQKPNWSPRNWPPFTTSVDGSIY